MEVRSFVEHSLISHAIDIRIEAEKKEGCKGFCYFDLLDLIQ